MSDPHVWGSAPDFVGPRHELREDLLMRALLASCSGGRVLNIGAGQGTFTKRLVQRGFDVVSTEFGAPALESLRERVAGDVVEADATALPFPDACFDVVVLGEVLEHIEDDALTLSEAARVVRPSGVLAASVPRNPSWFSASDRWAGHVRRYTRSALVAVVEGAGLRILDCSAWGFPVSALYHRTVYEHAIGKGAPERPGRLSRLALPVLAALLQIDRLFVGVERGALGYIVTARRPGRPTAE